MPLFTSMLFFERYLDLGLKHKRQENRPADLSLGRASLLGLVSSFLSAACTRNASQDRL